jgi:pimeloyl-ACP methyl ester carboxylesterase
MPLPDLSQYEKFVNLTNGRMRYYEAGSGDEHTILVPSTILGASADTFQFVIEPLAERLHVYAIDNLGFGESTRVLPQGPLFDVLVDGIREFMDLKGIESANFIGEAVGGWLACLLAYESPHRVRKLITDSVAGMNAHGPMGPGTSENDFLGRYNPPAKEGMLLSRMRYVYPGSYLTDDLAEAMIEQEFAHATIPDAYEGLKPLQRQMATPEIRAQYMLQRRLPHIKVPCLFTWDGGVAGREADTMDRKDPHPTWTQEYARLKGDMSKSSKPWVVPGAKYLMTPTAHIRYDRPDLLAKNCIEFITVPIGGFIGSSA